jgi:hypothetical protein
MGDINWESQHIWFCARYEMRVRKCRIFKCKFSGSCERPTEER